MKKSSKTLIFIGLPTLYSLFLLLFRIQFTHSIGYLFLVWNLFLAYIPLGITYFLKQKKRFQRSNLLFWAFFICWLVFLPNAPYIITDLFHLKPRNTMPLWYDLLLIVSFAINGFLAFIISVHDMDDMLNIKYSKKVSRTSIFTVLLLCGFGIYLGRYLRWNSWDLIHQPQLLIQDIITRIKNPLEHAKTWGVTLGYGSFFILSFILFKNMISQQKESANI